MSGVRSGDDSRRLLILSVADDVHSTQVRDELGDERCLIWNPIWNRDNRYSLAITDREATARIHAFIDEEVVELSPATVKAVWFRRPQPQWPRRHFRSLAYFMERERDDALDGILRTWESHGVRIVNRPEASFAASNKPRQLLAAARAGFRVPASLISNNPRSVDDHLLRWPECVLKGVSLSGADDGGDHLAIFVSRLDSQALDSMEERLPPCPATVQELVDWSVAIRIMKCGGLVRAFDLPRKASVDWRLFQDGTSATPRELPSSILGMLDDLFEELEISYGAVDLLEDRQGQIYFLEVNPNGQWLWLEEESGWPLLKEMSSALYG